MLTIRIHIPGGEGGRGRGPGQGGRGKEGYKRAIGRPHAGVRVGPSGPVVLKSISDNKMHKT